MIPRSPSFKTNPTCTLVKRLVNKYRTDQIINGNLGMIRYFFQKGVASLASCRFIFVFKCNKVLDSIPDLRNMDAGKTLDLHQDPFYVETSWSVPNAYFSTFKTLKSKIANTHLRIAKICSESANPTILHFCKSLRT